MRLDQLTDALPDLNLRGGAAGADTPGTSVEARLLRQVMGLLGEPPLAFRLWTGEVVAPPSYAATAVLRDRQTLLRLALHPHIGFGDAYTDGSLTLEGELLALMDAFHAHALRSSQETLWTRPLSAFFQLTQDNSLRGSREHIHHHYDIGNAFYTLWLDPTMNYTCAYYARPDYTLEQAQRAKMDHVCRKLQLQPGERVVEAGCGWGGLALHMAEHYGVRVRAFNISTEQIAFARERARARGLADRVEYVLDDYRNVSGRYDAFVSVGMLEHVGVDHFEELGEVIWRAVGDEGRGLLHFIGRAWSAPLNPWIRKRIFPGAHLPTIKEACAILEPRRYAILDVENLRQHYALTLKGWLDSFEAHRDEIEAMFDADFVRAWRLYLASSIGGFRMGTLQLFQILFNGVRDPRTPWTRRHLYTSAAPDDAGSLH